MRNRLTIYEQTVTLFVNPNKKNGGNLLFQIKKRIRKSDVKKTTQKLCICITQTKFLVLLVRHQKQIKGRFIIIKNLFVKSCHAGWR